MKRISKSEDGMYHVNGQKFPYLIGSRKQVFVHNSAYKTPGGLTKKQLYHNKGTNRIVSMKKHITAKKENRLVRYGFGNKKGKFGYVKIRPSTSLIKMRRNRTVSKTRKSRMSGGMNLGDKSLFQSQPASITA
jgi:hypothetical protein